MTDIYVQFLTAPAIDVEVPPNPPIEVVIGGGGGGRGGTVTRVGLALPDIFLVSGSPVTVAGTLTGALVAQAQKTFFAGPASGANAVPTFRTLAAGDIPDVSGTYLTKAEASATYLTQAAAAATYLTQAAAAATYQPKAAILTAFSTLANAAGWLHNDGTGVLAYSSPNKTDVGLGNVENVALSTWPGSTNITTLGTISVGIWNGSIIAGQYGGTGVNNAGKTLTLAASATVAGINSGGANPTATVTTVAQNGVATTFMRSDGAPAISQSLSPTMTGNWNFTPAAGIGVTINGLVNTTQFLVNSGNVAATVQSDILIQRAGSTANAALKGSNLTLSDTGAVTRSAIQQSGGQTEFWQFASSAWSRVMYCAGDLGVVLGAPTGGSKGAGTINTTAVYVNGTAIGGGSAGGNPTALVGLAAVNGVATTFLRSDGAPALDVSISPTWSGTHTFSITPVVPNASWTYAKIQNVSATNRFHGRITAGAGVMEELTGTQATTLLDVFTTALKGLAPASGGGTANYLRADGTWATPAGTTAGANPTALVGLAAVNGSATTFLRSDGAPALSQAIVPTWTGLHTFSAGLAVTSATDSTSPTTGSITTAGGLGVAKSVWIGGTFNSLANATVPGALPAGLINRFIPADATQAVILADVSATTALNLIGRSCDGTLASPTATTSNRIFVQLAARGFANGAYSNNAATLALTSANNWTSTDNSTQLVVSLTPIGSTIAANAFVLSSSLLTISGAFKTNDTTDTTSTTTGSITTAGGLGVAKSLFIGGATNLAGTLLVSGVATFNGSQVNVNGVLIASTADGSRTAYFAGASGTFRFTGYNDATTGSAIEAVNAAQTVTIPMTLVGSAVRISCNGVLAMVANSGGITVTGTIVTSAPAGGTSQPWKFGTVAVVSPTAPNRTVELEVNGTTYYLAAKTTNN